MSVPPLAETVASFDARSEDYDRSRMHQVLAEEAVGAADPQPGQTLLDLAGGTGLVARAALPRLRNAVVLDASPGMLREAGRREPRLMLVRADAHHVPLHDDSIDVVTCITALHLFHDPQRALREAARTCRRGGRVVFTTWAADGWSTSKLLRATARAQGVDLPDKYASSGTPAAAAELARASGLDDPAVRVVVHVEARTEDPDATWVRATAGHPPLPQAVREAFTSALGDEVEHRLLLVTSTAP